MSDTDPCAPPDSCYLLAGFAAGYDKAGNRLFDRHLHAECRSHTYDHDPASRLMRYKRGKLTEAGQPGQPPTVSTPITLGKAFQSFDYDLNVIGNWGTPQMTPSDTPAWSEQRAYNNLNQLTGIGSGTLTYDDNGNLTDDGTRQYTYDPIDRLKEVRQGGELIASYAYDALGRRVRSKVEDRVGNLGGIDRNVPAGSTYYLYAGDRCVEERNDGGQTLRQYVWGQYVDELVQQREYDPATNTRQDFYLLSDLTYRAVALVDKCQCPVETYDVDAYGRTRVFGDPGVDGEWFTDDDATTDALQNNRPYAPKCRRLFTGREYDVETGLHYFRARHYSPDLGRFLQRDPMGYDAGDMNLYAYCQSNPITNTDYDGMAVGQPGFWASLIPVWGSGRSAINDFQTGRWGWGIFDTAMAISDIFLAKTLFAAGGKALWKVGITAFGEDVAKSLTGQVGKNALVEVGADAFRVAEQQTIARGGAIYHITGSFDKVLSSGRAGGMTEGSVYASASRLTKWWQWLKAGVVESRLQKPIGRIVFGEEAAELFRPHPVEGWYSGAKRLLGQYKAPFGDVVFTRGFVSGSEMLVTTAKVEGHAVQSAAKAYSRLALRRVSAEWAIPHLFLAGENDLDRVNAWSDYLSVSIGRLPSLKQ